MKVTSAKNNKKHSVFKIMLFIFLILFYLLLILQITAAYIIQHNDTLDPIFGCKLYNVTAGDDKSSLAPGNLVFVNTETAGYTNAEILFLNDGGFYATGTIMSESTGKFKVETGRSEALVSTQKIKGQVMFAIPFSGTIAKNLNIPVTIILFIALPALVILIVHLVIFVRLLKEEKKVFDTEDTDKIDDSQIDSLESYMENISVPLETEPVLNTKADISKVVINNTLEFQSVKETSTPIAKPENKKETDENLVKKEEAKPSIGKKIEPYEVEDIVVVPQKDGFALGFLNPDNIQNIGVYVKDDISTLQIEGKDGVIDFALIKAKGEKHKIVIQKNSK